MATLLILSLMNPNKYACRDNRLETLPSVSIEKIHLLGERKDRDKESGYGKKE